METFSSARKTGLNAIFLPSSFLDRTSAKQHGHKRIFSLFCSDGSETETYSQVKLDSTLLTFNLYFEPLIIGYFLMETQIRI